jgi:sigma-B regulation protein RsbU (phosphoserine phosphatase)
MKRDTTLNNTSFSQLSKNSDFLNLILGNISSCVILLNNHMELQAYNDALKTIFSNKKDEDILYQKCGDVIGCAYAIDETSQCGTTSHCDTCDLRISALKSYTTEKEVFKEKISRPFYNHKGEKEMKHLQFSTRIFKHGKDVYIMMIVEDITKLVSLEERIKEIQPN